VSKFSTSLISFAFAFAFSASAANASSITLQGLTTPIKVNAQIKKAPEPISSGVGNAVASGLIWTGGESLRGSISDRFIAWCFDLIHLVRLGATYKYEVVDAPYSNSYLLEGANVRVSNLFNATYDSLNANDSIQAAAFQLAVREVANDDDFYLSSGVFQAGGYGSESGDITSTAQRFLSAGAGYDGPMNWSTTFIETREVNGTQNLVTAVRQQGVTSVPIPASGLLLLGGLAVLARPRKRAAPKT